MLRIARVLYGSLFIMFKRQGVILLSYPKSGNTILRLRIALVNNLILEPSHKDLNSVMPELGNSFYLNNSSGYYKTHRVHYANVSRIPVVSILRHPLDALASYYEYLLSNNLIDQSFDFESYLNSKKGIKWYRRHIRFLTRNRNRVFLVFYDEYLGNPQKVHETLSKTFDKFQSPDNIAEIINSTSRQSMTRADKLDIKDKDFSKKKTYGHYWDNMTTSSKAKVTMLVKDYELLRD